VRLVGDDRQPLLLAEPFLLEGPGLVARLGVFVLRERADLLVVHHEPAAVRRVVALELGQRRGALRRRHVARDRHHRIVRRRPGVNFVPPVAEL
jgi:hypothetical protein